MLDYRIYTFLSLCETLNYTRTAQLLQMTQPGVTQHIQFLEREYGCQLFSRNGRSLRLTADGHLLERHLQLSIAADRQQRHQISTPKVLPFRIGATKTIGEFVIPQAVCRLAANPQFCLELEVENTDVLLHRLDHAQIDLALLEGFFDKSRYAHRLIRREAFVGICSASHPFAGREVPLQAVLQQHILLREVGSGTRAILEELLHRHNYSLSAFPRTSCLSSFALMKTLLRQNVGVSFAYRAVTEGEEGLATFTLEGEPLFGEFNYVYLPTHSSSPWFLDAFVQAMEER